MPCDPPMNQAFTKINALSLVTFSNFCIICSYNSNERLVMFLHNIYPGLLKVMKMTRKRNGSVPSDDSDYALQSPILTIVRCLDT